MVRRGGDPVAGFGCVGAHRGRALEKMRSVTDGVTVKGVAEKEITADLATWRGQITYRAADLAGGYGEL
ncbi:MAG: hypothetical protein ACJ06V_10465 [Verrucomicrobiota bacterium]